MTHAAVSRSDNSKMDGERVYFYCDEANQILSGFDGGKKTSRGWVFVRVPESEYSHLVVPEFLFDGEVEAVKSREAILKKDLDRSREIYYGFCKNHAEILAANRKPDKK